MRVWDETDTPSEWSQEAKFRLASDDLSSGKWIGAITRKDSHLPEGRKFHGGELKKPEVKAALGSGRYFGKEKYLLAKNVSDRRGKREECESEIRKENRGSYCVCLWPGIL